MLNFRHLETEVTAFLSSLPNGPVRPPSRDHRLPPREQTVWQSPVQQEYRFAQNDKQSKHRMLMARMKHSISEAKGIAEPQYKISENLTFRGAYVQSAQSRLRNWEPEPRKQEPRLGQRKYRFQSEQPQTQQIQSASAGKSQAVAAVPPAREEPKKTKEVGVQYELQFQESTWIQAPGPQARKQKSECESRSGGKSLVERYKELAGLHRQTRPREEGRAKSRFVRTADIDRAMSTLSRI